MLAIHDLSRHDMTCQAIAPNNGAKALTTPHRRTSPPTGARRTSEAVPSANHHRLLQLPEFFLDQDARASEHERAFRDI